MTGTGGGKTRTFERTRLIGQDTFGGDDATVDHDGVGVTINGEPRRHLFDASARLAHVGANHVVGCNRAGHAQQVLFASKLEFGLEFVGGVEMVFHAALGAAGDKDHLADAGGVGLFDRVLDEGLVHHGQHLFGAGLGGGQETGAESGNREYGFGDG